MAVCLPIDKLSLKAHVSFSAWNATIGSLFKLLWIDIAQRQWKPNVEDHGQSDDVGAGPEIPEMAALDRSRKLWNRPARIKKHATDTAHPVATR